MKGIPLLNVTVERRVSNMADDTETQLNEEKTIEIVFITTRRIYGCSEEQHFTYACTIYYEVMGEWRKLHNGELRDLYSSPSIIRIIKSRRMRWAGHVERMGRRGTLIDCWWKSQRERTTRKTKP
jgi:hypothetical protein